ncbi:MAG: hypothetical protein HYT80_00100 [Euryarchaeota archaeon]|nr:hypothetical protein [Euryarchaeota archaeon]
MRAVLAAVMFALLTGTGAAPSHEEIPPHSASVEHATHLPAQPSRGEDVRLDLGLFTTANASSVKVVYCRVERYACAPALTALRTGDRQFNTTIPWHAAFFAEVETVGYQFEIHHANGTVETSPREHFPQRPAALPEAGGIYYYYALPRDAPGPSLVLGLLAVGALAWMGGRRA